MRIIDVRVAEAPIGSGFANAVIDFSAMTVSVVAVETDHVVDGERVVGYGFNSNGRYAQTGILTGRLLPRLRACPPERLVDPDTGLLDPVAANAVMRTNEKPGGHGDRAVAVGIMDMALWDAAAKAAGQPLHRLLRSRFDRPAPESAPESAPREDSVWVYAAGGYYYPDGTVGTLREEIRSYLDLGYRDVKIKVGGASLAEDVERVEAVLDLLPAGCRLAVDANGRFDLPTALSYAEALSAYDLRWYEEPLDPLDYLGHAVLAEARPGPLATGENLFAVPEVRNLLRHAGLRADRDVLQMDPSLSYGVPEYAAMLTCLADAGWSPERCVPHGGHLYNLAVAAAFGLGGCESYPRVFEPFGGFADDAPVTGGRVRLGDRPGVGIEGKADLHRLVRNLFD
ncbi:enolase C-terminal domain-like protein [Actinopolymorpha singaporensis]|uniref:L-alanine-DL-glutamate epimerase n=1 Tax=Actinopolymorpha singaporensis TaxID=117157 RepID=A0A1H1LAC2_9ACTN|nr:enolase C-terminal domain-like protein [Actinopolymorpha singaporensis]SDR71433.1 L-alanine-DL-glutamate epimerase [Actinopolymorpha singaporensis]